MARPAWTVTGWLQGVIGVLVSLQVLGGGWAVANLPDPSGPPPPRLDPAPAGSVADSPYLPVERASGLPPSPPGVAAAQEATTPPPPPPPAPEPSTRSTTAPPRAAIDVTPLGDLLRGLLPPLIPSTKPVL